MAQPILEHAIVTGERAALRPVRDADAPAAFAILHRRREVLDWLIWSGPEAVEDMREHYARWCVPDRSQGADRRGLMDDPETGGANYHFAITEPDGEFRGALTLRFLGHAHTGDLGYWIAPEAWNRGLGTEALRLAAWLAFERLEAVLLYARVFEGNDASARIRRSPASARSPPRPSWPRTATRTTMSRASRCGANRVACTTGA